MRTSVTLEDIKEKIKGESYLVLPDGRSTLCMLTLENGYTIKGVSACVDAANFNMDIGRKIAYEDAIRQIWPLEGYLLAEAMYWQHAVPVATNPAKKVFKAPHGLKKDGTPAKKRGRKAS